MSVIDYNKKMQFPNNDNYVNRITCVEFKESKSSGNPMLAITCEIVSPTTVEIAGKEVNVAGLETTSYYTTTVLEGAEVDTEETASKRERLEELYAKLGLDFKNENWQNPNVKAFENKVILTAMGSEVKRMHKTPTAEQLKNGQKQGDVMKDPLTGKEMVFYEPKIIEIFGEAPQDHPAHKAAGHLANKKPF
jgi:hypothetical protein